MPTARQRIVASLIATALCLGVLEVALRAAYRVRDRFVEAVPLPYRIGDDYGPTPPWLDRGRLLEWDDALLWRNRPSSHETYLSLFVPFPSDERRIDIVRRFSPRLPLSLRTAPRWQVDIDSRGFREVEFSDRKAAGSFRILCLGDSWTFGANVSQNETYPRALDRLLQAEFPAARFEVLNLGVMGYSSFQGKELLRTRALEWDPDLVVIGFGMNDGKVGGFRDKDVAATRGAIAMRAAKWLEEAELYKLLRYWALLVRDRLPSPAEAFRGAVDAERWVERPRDVAGTEPWTRVSVADYRANVEAMIDLASARGVGVVLVDNELEPSAYGETLATLAAEHAVPLVRSGPLIQAARARTESELAAALGLRPATSGAPSARSETVRVIFRVRAERGADGGAVYLAGDAPALGDLVPNQVSLRDDGEDGDERADDGVWSYAASLKAGSVVHYVYTRGGTAGTWENLDVPMVRSFPVPRVGGTVYRPIESFGRIEFQSDAWHADREGLELIARGVLQVLVDDPRVQSFTASAATGPANAHSSSM